jgi:hypothetical protein
VTDHWPQTDICPACDAFMRGNPIPEEHRRSHYPVYTHYSRLIGVEVRGVYDGILYWRCPDCGHCWNRWPTDHPRHAVAEREIAKAVVAS